MLAPAFFEPAPPQPVPQLGRWAALGMLTAGGAVVAIGLAAEPLFGAFESAALLPR